MKSSELRRIKIESGCWPSAHPREVRRRKLKMRYRGERLDTEIIRTREKLELLLDIRQATKGTMNGQD